MELDDLKTTWGELDNQLKKAPLAEDEQISRIVSACNGETRRSLDRITEFLRWSLWGAGTVLLLLILFSIYLRPTTENQQSKFFLFWGFLFASFLVAFAWDIYTYRLVRGIRVDTMSVAEVSRRIALFHRRTNYEVIGLSVWILVYTFFNYWYRQLYELSLLAQIFYFSATLLIDALVIYLLYRHKIYKPMRHAEENIRRLGSL